MTKLNVSVQNRRGLPNSWTTENPVLLAGQIGVETGTGKIKIGNGVYAWNALPYAGGGEGGSGKYYNEPLN